MRLSRRIALYAAIGGFSESDFTFTGGADGYDFVDDGSGNWRIKFLTGGVLRLKEALTIDAFLVGGGGSGGKGVAYCGAGGGGGGYTKTIKNITLQPNTDYEITIGGTGGNTIAFNETANGGSAGSDGTSSTSGKTLGGAGGSGGGAGKYNSSNSYTETHKAGDGGSDGSNGGNSVYATSAAGTLIEQHIGGKGQGTTTRAFGDADGELYAAGGGGGAGATSVGTYWSYNGTGGDGILEGGGDGGAANMLHPPTKEDELGSNGETPKANTGHGAGGGSAKSTDNNIIYVGGIGACGIVIIRNAR